MAHALFRLAVGFALLSPALSQKCEGQSCTIAALSGSSGQTYDPKTPPTGGSDAGDCCILTYNPSARTELYKEKPSLEATCAKMSSKRAELSYQEIATIKRATCTPYTLIFAKGTGEPGKLGITVGPALRDGLDVKSPGNWTITGVEYKNTVAGDDCLGLPGGMIAAKLLETTAKSCPDTKIVMSGYSEGAMVTHNGVAYSTAAARKRVDGVVVFGDPFDGAPIKAYSGPIKTYCAKGDHVCDGEFDISAAHLSYVGVDTTKAVDYISKLVEG